MLHTKTKDIQSSPYRYNFADSREGTTLMKDVQEPRTLLKPGEFFPYILGIISVAWLPYGFAGAVSDLFTAHFTLSHFIAIIIGASLFVGIYLWGMWDNMRYLANTVPPVTHVKASAWLTIVVLTALSIFMVESSGSDWGALFIFTCVYATSRLPTMQAIGVMVIILLLTIFGALRMGFSGGELVGALFIISITGSTIISMVRSFRTSQELRAAKRKLRGWL